LFDFELFMGTTQSLISSRNFFLIGANRPIPRYELNPNRNYRSHTAPLYPPNVVVGGQLATQAEYFSEQLKTDNEYTKVRLLNRKIDPGMNQVAKDEIAKQFGDEIATISCALANDPAVISAILNNEQFQAHGGQFLVSIGVLSPNLELENDHHDGNPPAINALSMEKIEELKDQENEKCTAIEEEARAQITDAVSNQFVELVCGNCNQPLPVADDTTHKNTTHNQNKCHSTQPTEDHPVPPDRTTTPPPALHPDVDVCGDMVSAPPPRYVDGEGSVRPLQASCALLTALVMSIILASYVYRKKGDQIRGMFSMVLSKLRERLTLDFTKFTPMGPGPRHWTR